MTAERSTACNSTFAIGGVSCSADGFVLAESFVLRIKFSGKNPAHRKSAKRYRKPYDDRANIKLTDMKRTFLKTNPSKLTVLSDSQRFVFKVFFANTQNTLSFFSTHESNAEKK